MSERHLAPLTHQTVPPWWCSMTTPAWSEPMTHCSFSSSIVKQELRRCLQQLLTLPQRGNLSLLLSPRMKDLLNITSFCLEWKVNTCCTVSYLNILLFVYVDDGTTPPTRLLCILPTMDVMRFCRIPRIVNMVRVMRNQTLILMWITSLYQVETEI